MEFAPQCTSKKSSPVRNGEASISNLNTFEIACTISNSSPRNESNEANENFPNVDGFIASSGHRDFSSSMLLRTNINCCDPSDPGLANMNSLQETLDTCHREAGSDQLSSTSGQTNTSDSVLFVDLENARIENNLKLDLESYETSNSSCTDLSSEPNNRDITESSGIGSRYASCFKDNTSADNSQFDETSEICEPEDTVEYNKFKRRSFYRRSFEEVQRIGKGSFGSVYEVRHKVDNHRYAIKCVKITQDDDAKRIIKEAQTLAKFFHHNIIRYFSSWIDKSSSWQTKYLCIQMELCKKTLKDWLQNVGRDELDKNRYQIVHQISAGLVYIHNQNYIHRDLKPANIFFALDNKIKIGDFGLVTSWKREGLEQFSRSPEVGTRLYMAPEQMSEVYNHKVDIYSLGLILFELMCPILQSGTNHEKQKIWTEVKDYNFPIDFTKMFPKETELLKTMLNNDSSKRPDALEVQNSIWNLPPAVCLEENVIASC